MNCDECGFDRGRLEKRARLLAEGLEPYPYEFDRTHTIGAALQESAGAVRLAGRLWARRRMGKIEFADLADHSGQIQLYLARQELEPSSQQCLGGLDLGDLIGVEGELFHTRTGQLSVRVSTLVVLAKTVVPVPLGKEDGAGVYSRAADAETQYRERHLHWLLDPAAKERVYARAQIFAALRQGLAAEDFLEVSTPTLWPEYGGAEARPFTTEVWALERQVNYLRIAPELHLKRYLVAGFERVFALCNNFRNEGIDRSHNPEFTMLEWYEAFADYRAQLVRFENLVAAVCRQVCGSEKVVYQGVPIDFTPPWRRLTVLEALEEYAGLAVGGMEVGQLRTHLEGLGIAVEANISWGQGVAALFEATCEAHLIQPTFVLDHPVEITPLAKVKRGDRRLAERFEPYVCGMELGNAYSELNDPVEQLERLVAQQGDDNLPFDREFVRALGCGMPPASGVGLGVDRLAMVLTDAVSIRDVIPFPMTKRRRRGA